MVAVTILCDPSHMRAKENRRAKAGSSLDAESHHVQKNRTFAAFGKARLRRRDIMAIGMQLRLAYNSPLRYSGNHYRALRCNVLRRVLPSLLLLIFLAGAQLLVAQRQSAPPPSPELSRPPLPSDDDDARSKAERDMAKRANRERQAAIQRDTDKLLELATQLKENVDKSSENTLSMDVIKKAEEIEKLAHSVREKMKGN